MVRKANTKIENRGHEDHSDIDSRQETRVRRNRLHGPRDILTLNQQIPGKHICLVTDDDHGQIQRFLDAGYEFVLNGPTLGETTVDRPVGTNSDSVVWKNVGAGRIGYLMAIDEEQFNAEQEALEEELVMMENEMFRTQERFEGSYTKQLDFDNRNIKR